MHSINRMSQSRGDDLSEKRYKLKPIDKLYPLDPSSQQLHYPDFQPWKHSAEQDIIAINHLQKGYLEQPIVSNELLSARGIMHQLLRSNNSLNELSTQIIKASTLRSTSSKINNGSFRPPPRVTLTDQKREAWLRDLASSDIPLRKLSRTIPHGVRNKILIEQCCAKSIPINRALWFVKCVGINELRGLKRKGGSNIELNWVHDWTLQVVEFIEKLSLEYISGNSDKQLWKKKVSYMLRFTSNLYIENLIDKDVFKNWLIKFFKNCSNFELPLSITLIKMFWDELIVMDYLVKELTETLLLNHQKVSASKNLLDNLKNLSITDLKLNDLIKKNLLKEFEILILKSFNQSIDNFIIPNNWLKLKPILNSILSSNFTNNNTNEAVYKKKFQLINYRNESLMINYSLPNSLNLNPSNNLISSLDSYPLNGVNLKKINELIFNEHWRNNLDLLINYGVTNFRASNDNSLRIQLIIRIFKNFKRNLTILNNSVKTSIKIKDFEIEILNILFNLKQINNFNFINFDNLFLILNELISLKLFKISSYLRKLISSGLIYSKNNDSEKNLHKIILNNFKIFNNSQVSMILKTLDPEFQQLQQQQLSSSNELILKATNIVNNKNINEIFNSNNIEFFKKDLDTFHKLKVSDLLIEKFTFLSDEMMIEMITNFDYNQIENFIKTFEILLNFNNLSKFLKIILEFEILNFYQLDFLILYFSKNVKMFWALNDFNVILKLILKNFKKINGFKFKLNNFYTIVKPFLSLEKDDGENEDGNGHDNGNDTEFFKSEFHQFKESNTVLENSNLNHLNDLVNLENLNQLIEPNSILNNNYFHNNFQVLIKAFSNNFTIYNLKLLNTLKAMNLSEFEKDLFIYIKKNFSNNDNNFKFDLILNLITTELISIDVIIEFFLNLNLNNSNNQFIKQLLFSDLSEFTTTENIDSFKLRLQRDDYKDRNPGVVLKFIKSDLARSLVNNGHSDNTTNANPSNITSTSSNITANIAITTSISNPLTNQRPNEAVLPTFQNESSEILNNIIKLSNGGGLSSKCDSVFNDDFTKICISSQSIVLDNFEKLEDQILIKLLLNSLEIEVQAEEQEQEQQLGSSLGKIINSLNIFNISIVQVLVKILFNDKVSYKDFMEYFKVILTNCDSNKESLIGSVFEMIDDALKIKFIHYLETMFLSSRLFPMISIGDYKVKIKTLTDCLISLSKNMENIKLSDELIFSLDTSLELLLKLVNQSEISFVEELFDSILLFLKIIIIHKSCMINIIIERNSIKENFLNNLVNLLTSKLILKNIQLKNLLYDLLLSIKSSINELNANQVTNTIKLPMSLTTLPVISNEENRADSCCGGKNYASGSDSGNNGAGAGASTSSTSTGTHTSGGYAKRQNLYYDYQHIQNLHLFSKASESFTDFNFKPFDILEESNPSENINDTAISLKLFEATIERENPK